MLFRSILILALLLGLSGCLGTTVTFQSSPLAVWDGDARQTVRGIFKKPEGTGPFPAVVLLHTCGGMMEHVVSNWPSVLNKAGYATLTVDTFGSRGAVRCPEAYRYAPAQTRDALGAAASLASRPDIDGTRIGVMGFSIGARAVEDIANAQLEPKEKTLLRAGVAVYGRCSIYGPATMPILELMGGEDRFAFACDERPKDMVYVRIFPNATHAFDNSEILSPRTVSGNHLAIYNPTATAEAEKAAVAFFDKHMSK